MSCDWLLYRLHTLHNPVLLTLHKPHMHTFVGVSRRVEAAGTCTRGDGQGTRKGSASGLLYYTGNRLQCFLQIIHLGNQTNKCNKNNT